MSHRFCLSMLFVLHSNMVWAACDSSVDVCLEQQSSNTIATPVDSGSTADTEGTLSVNASGIEVDTLVNSIN